MELFNFNQSPTSHHLHHFLSSGGGGRLDYYRVPGTSSRFLQCYSMYYWNSKFFCFSLLLFHLRVISFSSMFYKI